MHVLIVDDRDTYGDIAALDTAFEQAGFQVTSTGSQAIAQSCLRCGPVDLLVMAERVGGRLTHALSLLAECRNPLVETVLLTPRCDADIEELFMLLPSLHCIAAPDVAPKLVVKLAIAALAGAAGMRETGMNKASMREAGMDKASMDEPHADARIKTGPLVLTAADRIIFPVPVPVLLASPFFTTRRRTQRAPRLQEFA